MLQKSLGYVINKFRRFYRVPEKIVIFKKLKLQNLSHEIKQQMFYRKLFLIQNFDYRSTNGKLTGFLPYSQVKYTPQNN